MGGVSVTSHRDDLKLRNTMSLPCDVTGGVNLDF